MEGGMRNLIWVLVVVVAAALVLSRSKGAAPDPVHSGSTAVSIKTLQTYRSVTVSPSTVKCGHYSGGQSPNASAGALGFPNGKCSVGNYLSVNDPITITYNGFQGNVFVHAGWAMPDSTSGVGTPWHPCSPGGHEAVRCRDMGGLPNEYQYTVENFGVGGPGPIPITGNNVCDHNFRPGGGCYATRIPPHNAQHEGLNIIGPSWAPPTDTATSWTAWVIWMAVPPNY
jgi:hypothetical protein